MKKFRTVTLVAALATASIVAPPVTDAAPPSAEPVVSTLATGIQGASGSTIGPDRALYVTESATGQILRVDPESGATTVYASGLPTNVAPIGGPMDLVFRGHTAYVLVSLVGDFFGTTDPSGIYRMDGPDEWTVIADLGAWAVDHPPGPDIDYFIPTGVHYAIEKFRGGFVVSEAHHNKVLQVTPGGDISELATFGNVVPAGMEVHGNRILLALTGPAPHLPEDGQIVSIDPSNGEAELVAAGGPLMVDVERGRSNSLFGLAQGFFTPGTPDGSPANADTGELLSIDDNGGVSPIVEGLDRPTSLEIQADTAFVVGLAGTVVRIDNITGVQSLSSSGLSVTGDESGFLARHPHVVTETFEQPADFDDRQHIVSFHGIKFNSVDPTPTPKWQVGDIGNNTGCPDGCYLYRQDFSAEAAKATMSFRNGGFVHTLGFRLVAFAQPNQFLVRVVEADGSSSSFWLSPDVTEPYVGLHSATGVRKVTITQRHDLADGSTTNFGFDEVTRSSITGTP